MRDNDGIILEILYEEISKKEKISLLGVVKLYVDNATGETYKSKLEFKNTTKDFERYVALNQHDVYWDLDEYDPDHIIEYDRWKYNKGFNSGFDDVLVWTEKPQEDSKTKVLFFLKEKFNITPKKQIVWTDFIETERQKLMLRNISGD